MESASALTKSKDENFGGAGFHAVLAHPQDKDTGQTPGGASASALASASTLASASALTSASTWAFALALASALTLAKVKDESFGAAFGEHRGAEAVRVADLKD